MDMPEVLWDSRAQDEAERISWRGSLRACRSLGNAEVAMAKSKKKLAGKRLDSVVTLATKKKL
jgi:hypothetical protein